MSRSFCPPLSHCSVAAAVMGPFLTPDLQSKAARRWLDKWSALPLASLQVCRQHFIRSGRSLKPGQGWGWGAGMLSSPEDTESGRANLSTMEIMATGLFWQRAAAFMTVGLLPSFATMYGYFGCVCVCVSNSFIEIQFTKHIINHLKYMVSSF